MKNQSSSIIIYKQLLTLLYRSEEEIMQDILRHRNKTSFKFPEGCRPEITFKWNTKIYTLPVLEIQLFSSCNGNLTVYLDDRENIVSPDTRTVRIGNRLMLHGQMLNIIMAMPGDDINPEKDEVLWHELSGDWKVSENDILFIDGCNKKITINDHTYLSGWSAWRTIKEVKSDVDKGKPLVDCIQKIYFNYISEKDLPF